MIDKTKVKQGFDRAYLSYDNAARIQKDCGEKLVEMIENECKGFYPKSVLDLGTGTGTIAALIKNKFPLSNITLNDISPNMLRIAKKNLGDTGNINSVLGDMETANLDSHNLIISNFAMQWVSDLNVAINKFYKKSNLFAFTCLLDGTFAEWSNLFHDLSLETPVHKYAPENDLTLFINSLHPKQHKCISYKFQLEFASVRSFIRYLKNLGADYGRTNVKVSDLRKIINYNPGTFTVTYNVFFAILRRE